MSASRGLPRRTPFLLIARPISSPLRFGVIGFCLSVFLSIAPPRIGKLSRTIIGERYQASYWGRVFRVPFRRLEISLCPCFVRERGTKRGKTVPHKFRNKESLF